MKYPVEKLLANLPPVKPLPELLQFNNDSDESRAAQARRLNTALLRVFYLSDAELWLLGREFWFPSAYFGGREPAVLCRWDQWRPILVQFLEDWAENLERKPPPPPAPGPPEPPQVPPGRGTGRSRWERFRDWLSR